MQRPPKLKTRIWIGLLLAQFLNVQIQSAFATDAVLSMQSNYQFLVTKLEGTVAAQFSKMTEDAQVNFAERVMLLGVRGNNRLRLMSDKKFERRMKNRILKSQEINENTQEEEGVDADESGLPENALAIQKEISEIVPSLIKVKSPVTEGVEKTHLLARSDEVLMALGAQFGVRNRLIPPDHHRFKSQLLKVASRNNGLANVVTGLLIVSFALMTVGLSLAFSTVLFPPPTGMLFITLLSIGSAASTVNGKVMKPELSWWDRIIAIKNSFQSE